MLCGWTMHGYVLRSRWLRGLDQYVMSHQLGMVLLIARVITLREPEVVWRMMILKSG